MMQSKNLGLDVPTGGDGWDSPTMEEDTMKVVIEP
jgi:hypothetical protein